MDEGRRPEDMDNNRGEQQSAHAPHHPLISKLAFAIWDEAFAGHTELTARDAGPHPPSCRHHGGADRRRQLSNLEAAAVASFPIKVASQLCKKLAAVSEIEWFNSISMLAEPRDFDDAVVLT